MCLMILAASDRPLSPPYAAEVGGLIVRPLTAAEAAAFQVFSKPYVHGIGFAGGCGCEFSRPEGMPRRGLVWLLEWALRLVPSVELFICNQGGEGEQPIRRDWASAAELLVWQRFHGGEFLVIHRDT
jgi:hypothetical protein